MSATIPKQQWQWNANHIADQLERHLSLDSITEPSLEAAITRMHFVTESFVQLEHWEELEWLIQETKHYVQKRESKHPFFKRGPRRKLQFQVGYYGARAAIAAVAILSSIEARYLQLRGRNNTHSKNKGTAPLEYPSTWVTLREASKELSADIEKVSVLQISRFLENTIAPLTHLIENTSPPEEETSPAETFAHFKWHTLEITTLSSPLPFIQEWKQIKEQNRLLTIALEKLFDLLALLRARLITQSL